MSINFQKTRQMLADFDFKTLFIEELGWVNTSVKLTPFTYDGVTYGFTPVAEQGGMVVLVCRASTGDLPTTAARRKIDKWVTTLIREHIIIFVDDKQTVALWTWFKRDGAKAALRQHRYHKGQSADALLQKLGGIAFDLKDLDAEGRVHIGEVTARVNKAFDVEAVTKKFYDLFQKEHGALLDFLKGIDAEKDRAWYTSVMLNRLMFLYFIQKKDFLANDRDYLRHQLEHSEAAGENYYQKFLCDLFFEGMAKEAKERTPEVAARLGAVPYLNGGLFLPHEVEERWGSAITIPNEAFKRLYDFFDNYDWHLDDRPLRKGNEINPDVLGYIFEKYINQKQMGAYYTKEDITGYICRSTILPFLLSKVDAKPPHPPAPSPTRGEGEFSKPTSEGEGEDEASWIEPYIFDAVKTPDTLPTETEREYNARRQRYQAILDDYAAGKIATVDDLITYNLDLEAFAEDWLRGATAEQVRTFYQALTRVTVLDPTCGSGAFLFAAIQILEPLYDVALERMAHYADSLKHNDFVSELTAIDLHPSRRYFILKRIIVNNLYGVDIMPEAVEICKLRLFLKLAAQVADVKDIEPLPDIDFNIRAGNTLVGFATKDEIDPPNVLMRMYDAKALLKAVEVMEGTLRTFRRAQLNQETTAEQMREMKASVQRVQADIRDKLDVALMDEYGQTDLAAFRASHQPFHWYVEFNHVVGDGGFDVIVGNPPYVEYSKVRKEYAIRGYETEASGNLYAFTLERTINLMRLNGWFGMIVPMSFVSTERVTSVRELLLAKTQPFFVSNYSGDAHPAVLFDGVKMRLSILVGRHSSANNALKGLYTTKFQRWYSEARGSLFESLSYKEVAREFLLNSLIPKVSSSVEIEILKKLFNQKRRLNHFVVSSPLEHSIYAHRIVSHFVKAFDFIPHFWNEKDGIKKSEDYKVFSFNSATKAMLAASALNSTVFYFFYLTYSDAYHCGRDLILAFPFDLDDVTEETSKKVQRLNLDLMHDMKAKAKKRRIQYRTGWIEYDEFYPRLSKPIIDEIDRVLAQHYGFTDEELDFIIHYDIKYRMGKDSESSNGDEGE